MQFYEIKDNKSELFKFVPDIEDQVTNLCKQLVIQGVPKRKLYKELLITCRFSIIILHLAYHLKGEYIKIV